MAIEYSSTPTGMPGDSPASLQQEERRAVIRRIEDAKTAVTEKTREAARYANRTVYGNPWSSVGVAFGTGMLLGLLAGLSLRR
ncbi:MAG TPA: hypothetical protein VFC18_00885 [Burkholderiales bacterium]|nr:hypothetical protein [Burkholderiales bacterium]